MQTTFFFKHVFCNFFVKILWVMYSEMHLWCYNIKNYYMKHSKKWDVHCFQIDGQAFTSLYCLLFTSSNACPPCLDLCLYHYALYFHPNLVEGCPNVQRSIPSESKFHYYKILQVTTVRGKTENNPVYKTTRFSLKVMERRIKMYILCHFYAYT